MIPTAKSLVTVKSIFQGKIKARCGYIMLFVRISPPPPLPLTNFQLKLVNHASTLILTPKGRKESKFDSMLDHCQLEGNVIVG